MFYRYLYKPTMKYIGYFCKITFYQQEVMIITKIFMYAKSLTAPIHRGWSLKAGLQ